MGGEWEACIARISGSGVEFFLGLLSPLLVLFWQVVNTCVGFILAIFQEPEYFELDFESNILMDCSEDENERI